MKDACRNRVVWIKVAGLLGMTIAYLSTRRYFVGLDPLYRVFIPLGVTLIVTWLAVLWRPDCSVLKGRVLAVFTLLFGAFYVLTLWLWGTEWMMILSPFFLLWSLLWPARRHPSP